MTVVTTLDVEALTAPEYRAVLDELGLTEPPGLVGALPGRPRTEVAR